MKKLIVLAALGPIAGVVILVALGLLNTLTEDQIQDLVAFLFARGDKS